MAKNCKYIKFVFFILLIAFAAPLAAAGPLIVVIEGIEGAVYDNVVRALSFPEGFVEVGEVDPVFVKRFGEDADSRVRRAMEPFGFYHAEIAVQTREKAPGEFELHVKVNPGEPVRVADVSVILHGPGSSEASLLERAAAFPLTSGDVLLQGDYEEAKEKLRTNAQDMGYLDATFPVHEILIDTDALRARISLEMETGDRYFFGDAKIEGATDYPDAFLRRYLSFSAGDVFSYLKMGETQINFINSERFREVNITPEKEKATGSRIPVFVSLKPGRSRSLRQGIGYGTDTGGRFSLRYRDMNVFNLGHELQSNLYLSEVLQGLATSYTIPDDMDVNSYNSAQLNLQREDVSAYKTDFVALEIAKTGSLAKKMLVTGYLKFQYEKYTIGLQDSNARLIMPGLRFSGSFYDGASRPEKGFHFAVEARGTDQFMGANMGLFQVIAEGGFILPLPGRFFLHTKGKVGSSILGDPLADLPPSLRFFAGGDQSVRGYAYQSLGTRDASGQVVGGKQLLFGSLELEKAIGANWGASVFYDTGNAFDNFSDLRMAQGGGLGLHYYTSVGGLNFYVARQINVDDPGMRIHFTVGIGF
jgi:translocation and assembly module TamA